MRRKPPALRNIGIDRDARALARFECGYRVELVHGCAHRFVAGYAFEGTELVYSDPPYLKGTRTSRRRYRYDYEEADHVEWLELLKALPCPVMVSGYPSALYDERLARWRRVQWAAPSRLGSLGALRHRTPPRHARPARRRDLVARGPKQPLAPRLLRRRTHRQTPPPQARARGHRGHRHPPPIRRRDGARLLGLVPELRTLRPCPVRRAPAARAHLHRRRPRRRLGQAHGASPNPTPTTSTNACTSTKPPCSCSPPIRTSPSPTTAPSGTCA